MRNRLPAVLSVLIGCLLQVSGVWADVRDSTGLFSSSAIQQANSTIAQIRQRHNKDVVVETFPQIPQGLQSQYNPGQKAQFFNAWLRQRAQELKVNGIYALICREPSYLDVGVGAQTQKQAFTLRDRDELSSLMLDHFRRKDYDGGLLAGVGLIEQRMAANLGATGQPQYLYQQPRSATPKTGLSWIWWALIIGGGAWLLMRLLRRRGAAPSYGAGGAYRGQLNQPPSNYPPQGGYPSAGPGGYPPGQGGGGWGRGLLGGLLGGAAGGWLYDRFARGGESPPAGGSSSNQPGQAPPPMQSSSDEGQGFSGTGGDFHEPSGPEAGGGGDSGGGGGDSGGSGGDF